VVAGIRSRLLLADEFRPEGTMSEPRWKIDANGFEVEAPSDETKSWVARVILGWDVDRVHCYDEEGVEGWRWTSPLGRERTELGDHSEPPPWCDDLDDEFRAAVNELVMRYQ
jgi:hypothetical protein